MSKPYQKHPSVIVLEALTMGIEVDLAGLDIQLDEYYNMTIPQHDINGDQIKDHRLIIDYGPLSAFIHGCELLTDDQIAVIAADITMKKMGRGKA